MSGKFNFHLAKEAKTVSEGVASASQKKDKKRKRTLSDIRVVDDHPTVKSSAVDPSVVLAVIPTRTPRAGASANPSPARSSRRTR